MPGDLATYINDIRRRNAPGRRWYWPKNAHRSKPVAYLLEFNPITLVLRARRYIKRRKMLAPLMVPGRPTGIIHAPNHFILLQDRRNSYEIQIRTEPAPLHIERADPLPSSNHKLIIFHAYYEEESNQIISRLEPFTDYDILLTTPIPSIRDRFLEKFDPTRAASFLIPNRGRDVLPMLLMLSFIDLSKYTHFVKIHTKRSAHHLTAGNWYSTNIEILIGSREMTDQILTLIDPSRPEILGTECKSLRDHYKSNRPWLQYLFNGQQPDPQSRFIPGTMFAGSAEFLRRLAALNLYLQDFEPESAQLDGTLAHALERYFGHLATTTGGICDTIDSHLPSPHSPSRSSRLRGKNSP